jgi:hypothetical protein
MPKLNAEWIALVKYIGTELSREAGKIMAGTKTI